MVLQHQFTDSIRELVPLPLALLTSRRLFLAFLNSFSYGSDGISGSTQFMCRDVGYCNGLPRC
nr:hypothetical protein [Hymenobacter sp.]